MRKEILRKTLINIMSATSRIAGNSLSFSMTLSSKEMTMHNLQGNVLFFLNKLSNNTRFNRTGI